MESHPFLVQRCLQILPIEYCHHFSRNYLLSQFYQFSCYELVELGHNVRVHILEYYVPEIFSPVIQIKLIEVVLLLDMIFALGRLPSPPGPPRFLRSPPVSFLYNIQYIRYIQIVQYRKRNFLPRIFENQLF
jgi:hypothetical protein